MNLSFLPADLHLSRNADGVFVVKMAGQEIMNTKSERSAVATFNSLRSELKQKFPVRDPTLDEKMDLLQREINESVVQRKFEGEKNHR